jgi:hypothetical protein
MAGLATGATRSRMTQSGHGRPGFFYDAAYMSHSDLCYTVFASLLGGIADEAAGSYCPSR